MIETALYAVIIYVVGVWVLVHLSETLRRAGAATPTHGPQTARRLIAGLWAWAVVANVYAFLIGSSFLWLAPSLALPLLVVIALLFRPSVSELLRNVELDRLVGVQVYRIAGALFLISFFVFGGEMSREFAVKAGWGDVITGVLALPVAWIAWKRMPFWPAAVIAWCLFGIGDLVLAPVTARLHGGPPVDGVPLNTIPVFFGPPLGISLHLIALRALWLQQRKG